MVQREAQDFNSRVFGNIFKHKRSLEACLRGIQCTLEHTDIPNLAMLERDIHKEYNEVLKQEEILWYQKSREKWVKLGDRNTKFFHTQTIVHRQRNKIQGMHIEDGSWCTDTDTLKAVAITFFQSLFSAESHNNVDHLSVPIVPQLNQHVVDALLAQVTLEEVHKAVCSMKSYKAPGPDGFQPIFFKHLWELVKTDLLILVQQAFERGYFETCLSKILIVLHPKVDQPLRFKELRPISLCNVTYKMITKVVVQRLRPYLDELIGSLQSSFIPDRGTKDNAILAQEVVHYMHHSKSKQGTIAFKIDLEKAYDRVSWEFLEYNLRRFGFLESTISLIMWCVKSSSLSILWNGEKLHPFKPTRGLRQGDPLSPYLFVLCMEMLALNIQYKVNQGAWRPIRVAKGRPSISHLFFADDVLLFCQATPSQVQVVMDSINDFCIASGLKVNFDKSKAMCSAKVPRQRQQILSNRTSITFVSNLGTYLGFPLVNGHVNHNHYNMVVERIQQRMVYWKGRLLNKAGKMCLVNSVTSSIPVYTMQTHAFPKSVCNKIDSITRNFF